ncbi:hypothetical protein RIF29_19322 [Crotalaria pallida]|uniref:Uncharacterized protein n=1 Tax=Crotalaria pallida TaxID=3830 RepID=A0AAN9EZ87_CROPI
MLIMKFKFCNIISDGNLLLVSCIVKLHAVVTVELLKRKGNGNRYFSVKDDTHMMYVEALIAKNHRKSYVDMIREMKDAPNLVTRTMLVVGG